MRPLSVAQKRLAPNPERRRGEFALGDEWADRAIYPVQEYLRFWASNGRWKGMLKVHWVVMLAFVGPCPKGLIVCHNDGDKTNNRLSNLRYDTQRSNALDRTKHQLKGSV